MRRYLHLIVVMAVMAGAGYARTGRTEQIEQSPYPVTEDDRAYFAAIQDAIQHDKRDWLADQVLFPQNTGSIDGKRLRIESKQQFLRHYASIINAYVRTSVREQKPSQMFKNGRGIMIGDGALWIVELGVDEDKPFQYYISTINNMPPR